MTRYNRRSIRLPDFDYTQPGAYFVTLVTHNRISLFGEIIDGQMSLNPLGKVAAEQWERLPSKFPGIALSEYCVMPNHFHGILVISEKSPVERKDTSSRVIPGSLGAIIRAYKLAVTFRAKLLSNDVIVVWQRNYYEHIIRNEAEMRTIYDYIQANAMRWCDDRFYTQK